MELAEVHDRICTLEKQRLALYRERSRQIADFGLMDSMRAMPEGALEFRQTIRQIEEELTGLWALKRSLLPEQPISAVGY